MPGIYELHGLRNPRGVETEGVKAEGDEAKGDEAGAMQ